MKLKTKTIPQFFLTIFFVLIYFTPEFRFLPYYTWALAMVGFLLVVNSNVRKNLCFGDRTNTNFLILFAIGLGMLGIIIPISHFTFDFSYVPLLLGMILCLLRNFLVVYVIKKHSGENGIRGYMDLFLNACCICVMFTLLFIAFPGFKSFWLNNVIVNNASEAHASWAAYEFRYSIGGFAAYAYATIFSFAIIMAAYFICANGASMKDIIRFIAVCVGGFFYGRITLFAILIGLVLILFKSKSILSLMKFLLIMGCGATVLLMILNQLGEHDSRFVVWSNWAFSFVRDLFVRKEITTHSVTYMLNDMYFIPEFSTLLIGDGYYTDPVTARYYMSTDVGYMRMILYGGIISAIIAYTPMFYMLKKIMEKTQDKLFKRFIIALFIMWLILEAKGESYYRVILVMYPVLLLVNRRKV